MKRRGKGCTTRDVASLKAEAGMSLYKKGSFEPLTVDNTMIALMRVKMTQINPPRIWHSVVVSETTFNLNNITMRL